MKIDLTDKEARRIAADISETLQWCLFGNPLRDEHDDTAADCITIIEKLNAAGIDTDTSATDIARYKRILTAYESGEDPDPEDVRA